MANYYLYSYCDGADDFKNPVKLDSDNFEDAIEEVYEEYISFVVSCGGEEDCIHAEFSWENGTYHIIDACEKVFFGFIARKPTNSEK